MAVSIRILGSRIIPAALIAGVTLFSFAGCHRQQVWIVSDPYIEALGEWPPTTPSFIFRSRLSGMRITLATTNKEKPISQLLSEAETLPDILVLSPWNRYESLLPVLEESRIIIAGGTPPAGAGDKVTGLAADHSRAFAEVGRIAGEIAGKEGAPALLLTDRNLASLRETYGETAGEEFPLAEVIVKSVGGGDPVPESFLSQVDNSSVLLLFAGPMNIAAYDAGADAGLPVITEYAFGQGLQDDRIIASIEDDGRKMAKILLELMRKGHQDPIVYYPTRVEK